MLHVLLIIFLISLFYLSIANRLSTYVNVAGISRYPAFLCGDF